jgi:quercetin dioxygenase-like cupin family protein
MPNTVLTRDAYAWAPFPIPGHIGDLKAAFLNRDLTRGPIVAAMTMAPGARIPAHVHRRATETFLVIEGDFIEAGEPHGPGAFFAIAPGDVHGPHETTGGCTVVFMQSVEVDPTDFEIAE